MKELLVYSTFIFLLLSCSPKVSPVKGTYLNGPYQVSTTESFDRVWDQVIDLFAQKGLSIKIIDRSSGLIVSDKSQLTFTRENKTGKLIDSTAWVVIPSIYNPGPRKYEMPSSVTGEWNVRIKKNEDDKTKTTINVNLVNIQAIQTQYTSMYSYQKTTKEFPIDAKSTGNFEKLITDLILNKT